MYKLLSSISVKRRGFGVKHDHGVVEYHLRKQLCTGQVVFWLALSMNMETYFSPVSTPWRVIIDALHASSISHAGKTQDDMIRWLVNSNAGSVKELRTLLGKDKVIELFQTSATELSAARAAHVGP